MGNDRGFSLVEMLVSVTIMLAVTAGIFAVMNPAHGTFQTQPEVADMQQRLRVGVDTLYKDILMAGAGAYSGTQAGALNNFFAPVLPYKQGANAAIDDGALRFRSDGITLMYIPQTVAQTTISAPMPNESAELKVNNEPGCPPPPAADSCLCGFKVGMTVLIYDDSGSFDTLTVTQVQCPAAHLQHNQQGDLSKKYSTNAKITQMAMHVYYLDTTTNQLMHYDGTTAGVANPVVDNVVGLSFEYWGDPTPPALKKPGTDQSVTYGPKPPALGLTQPPAPAVAYWPAGTNCTIDVTGAPVQQVSRLPSLGAVNAGLVKLNDPANPNTSLTDGPWCPDPNNVNKWDADLLRVRKITVTLRVQAALEALRGPAGTLFTKAGTSRGANSYAPDQEVKFDVAPRNLNLGR